MIVKTSKGHQVKSEGGKNLSSNDLTASEAKKRLEQVEYFKRKDAGSAKRWAKS